MAETQHTAFCLNSPDHYNVRYVHNELYENDPEPRSKRPKGHLHAEGRCGYMGSLCSTCHELELKWHLGIAEQIGKKHPPLPNEDPGQYWRRVGGRFIDTWWEAALCAIKTAASQPGAIRTLTCCCCGEATRGRQWWNRDTGYGICPQCVEYVRSKGESEEEIAKLYGERGIHWGLSEVAA